jgi:hypothetical protein
MRRTQGNENPAQGNESRAQGNENLFSSVNLAFSMG